VFLPPRVSQSERALILLVFVCAAILYGSLWPWQIVHPSPGDWKLFWDERHLTHEFILNIILYIPVGFLVFAVTRNVTAAIAAGFVLSAFVEGIQPFFARDARALDVAANTAGAAAGTMFGFAAYSLRREIWMPSRPLIVLGIWAFHELYPFVRSPFYRYYVSSFSGGSPADFAEAAIDWLAAFAAAACAFPGKIRVAVLGAAAILPLKTVVLGMRSSRAEWFAWAVAAAASLALGTMLLQAPRLAGAALAFVLLLRELAPYHLASVPVRFHFFPMEALLSSDWYFAVLVITQKAFAYIAIIYLIGEPDALILTTACISAGLAVLEWLQRYLPGRVPDITDPVLALVLGAVLILSPSSVAGRALRRAT
jgi:VanZ family protein